MAATTLPNDEHDARLISHVHPAHWKNPEPLPRYNLVVIGAGTAGLVAAAGAAGLGAKVALIERDLMGGDCLNVGCVPSKALIRAARSAAAVRNAGQFGVHVPAGVTVDFPAVMQRMRALRANLSPHDSAARFRDLGIDVYLGSASFVGPDAVSVDGKTIRFRKAVIATGARAHHPEIRGIDAHALLTNENVFALTELPNRLAIIGAGPIGCELAQAFARFGSKVTLISNSSQILPKEDREAAERVARSLVRDGVEIMLDCKIDSANCTGSEHNLTLVSKQEPRQITVDKILAGAGRIPNVEGLNLSAAGVTFDSKFGVTVNDRLQTSNANIYAAGDICSQFKFTHAADAMARIVIQNALFAGRKKASALTIPWCTYTDPEVAHVGMSEQDAAMRGVATRTFMQELHRVDRAILDGEEEGFLKVIVGKKNDRILGATVVAAHAGELISEITLAMVHNLGLGKIAAVIHPYPTQAEAIKKVADSYQRTRLTPLVASALKTWLRWTR